MNGRRLLLGDWGSVDDALASALGGLLLILWGTRGRATTRRLPPGCVPSPARSGGRSAKIHQ